MNGNPALGWICFFIGLMLGAMLCGAIVHTSVQSIERSHAIKAGVARYTVDPATGITKFEYVKP